MQTVKDLTMLVMGWALIFAVGYGIAATIDGHRGCATDEDCAQQCDGDGGPVSDEPDAFDVRKWEA